MSENVEKVEKAEGGETSSVNQAEAFDQYEMGSIFSDDLTESVAEEVPSSGGGDPNIYSISLNNENVVNGVYKSVGRFIKNPRVPKWDGVGEKPKPLNIVQKWQYFLPDPDNPAGKLVLDCTSNFGQRDNIISTAFFYLRNTKNPSYVRMAKDNFSRKSYYYTLMQIVKDVQQPDLEGKIKVLRFATQVNEKIEDITKTDDATNQIGVNYSHPITGRNFIFNLEEEEFENKTTGEKQKLSSYSKSKFADTSSILVVPNCAVEVENKPEYHQEIFKYMLAESPILEEYKAKPWTEEDEKKAIEAVRMVIGDDNVFNAIYKKMYKKSYAFDGNTMVTNTGGQGAGLQLSEEALLETKENEPKIEIKTPETTGAHSYTEEDELPDDLEQA